MTLKSKIESLLFIQGEPMDVSRIAKISGASKKDVEGALDELAREYAPTAEGRGIVLVANNGQWQFATHPKNKELVEKFVTSGLSEELTRAGLEVLAIIAYTGPVSRARVEYMRGVNSSFTLRNLLIRGLVEREENPDNHRSYLYCVSNDFLKHLGLAQLEDLPDFKEFRSVDIVIPESGSQELDLPRR